MGTQDCLRTFATPLCIRCTQLPFQDLFWTPSYSGGATGEVTEGHTGSYYRGVRCFASFSEVWREDNCVFCALLKDTFKTFYTPEALERLVRRGDEAGLYLFQGPLDVNLGRLTKVESDVPLSLSVVISRNYNDEYALSASQSLPTSDLTLSPQLIALRKDATDTILLFPRFGRDVNVDKIDWSMVRGWVDSCVKHTADGIVSRYDKAGDLHLRAVDVIDGCVVDLPPRAQYVALSYAWGKDQRVKLQTDNLLQLSSKGYLRSDFGRPSKTIVDATHVVRSLGYRYLWVDALCIIQDDAASIQQNVMEMDRVYSHALFTIVAAAGMDANHGLPGVSPETPRIQNQHRAIVNGLHIANRLQSDINSTWWNTRGWTYQERVLSSRLLFFSEVQVEYRCEDNCSFQEQFHDAYRQASFSLFDSISNLDFTDTNLFTVYANAVTEYTRRSITNQMDKLKAFQGILGRLKGPFQAPFLFGLPILLFDVGLLWYPTGSLTRSNKAFPSWSWAGWDGPVQWCMNVDEQLLNLCESTVSICTIHYHYGKTSVPLCTDTPPNSIESSGPTWERHFDEETDEIYYTSQAESHKGHRYPRPLTSTSSLKYHGITNTKFTALEIQGSIATLRLTGQHSTKIKTKCSLGIHEKCNLAVLDGNNRVAGTVTVDGRLIPQLQGRTHRFLGLSRSTYIRVGLDEETVEEYIEPTWDREQKRFRSWASDCTNSQGRDRGDRIFDEYDRPLEDWIAEPSSSPDGIVRSSPIPGNPESEERSQQYFSRDEADWERNGDSFDKKEFSDRVYWPRVNVLLLSQETEGCVERIGCGEIHIDAFVPIAQTSTVLLR
ncbi:hypothetical protein EKO27_g3823 [Xylaria grammica]|uniref:Heterokaryon incompatibility domain-containing protein n=1 Tax=Xylaria grammica TaxID=363999 RepID=A0A439DA42_9PEZI|nr:hypothetical protein EKO27_g3823 [Xylaria grammica]